MEYNKEMREIRTNKELNNLDKFALEFINIIKEYVDYVIISGYVSILLGRTRVSEDIDVYIKKTSLEEFKKMYKELLVKNFWCINAEKPEEIYEYLKDNLAVRFSKIDSPIPNFEVKFPKDQLDEQVFEDPIKVILNEGEIIISSLERHIAFKKYFLRSNKDIEDAKHIENLFKESIDYNKVSKLKELIKKRNEKRKEIYETWKDK